MELTGLRRLVGGAERVRVGTSSRVVAQPPPRAFAVGFFCSAD